MVGCINDEEEKDEENGLKIWMLFYRIRNVCLEVDYFWCVVLF